MPTPPTTLTRAVDANLDRIAMLPAGPERLERQLRQLAVWRSMVLSNTLAELGNCTIPAGPFRGMCYPVAAAEGCRAPRLLGTYEASLHPVLESVIARGYAQVINIGCAEGYYAVGLSRRMPGATVHARDRTLRARNSCAELARLNGVADRVVIGGEVAPDWLAICADRPTFVLCDIEGAERQLLDPVLAPALAQTDILVEVHEGQYPGLLELLETRFSASHRVTRIDRTLRPDLLPDWAERLSDLDRLLLLWEFRSSPTPWLWMECR